MRGTGEWDGFRGHLCQDLVFGADRRSLPKAEPTGTRRAVARRGRGCYGEAQLMLVLGQDEPRIHLDLSLYTCSQVFGVSLAIPELGNL